jgi:hypothetical protein
MVNARELQMKKHHVHQRYLKELMHHLKQMNNVIIISMAVRLQVKDVQLYCPLVHHILEIQKLVMDMLGLMVNVKVELHLDPAQPKFVQKLQQH